MTRKNSLFDSLKISTKEEEEKNEKEDILPLELIEVPQDWRDKVNFALAKTNSFVSNVGNLAYKASSLLATLLMSKQNPVATGMAIVAVVPEILNFFQSASHSKIDGFHLAIEGYEPDDSGILTILDELGLLATLPRFLRWKAGHNSLISVKVEGEVSIIYRGDPAGTPNWNRIWVKQGLDLSEIISKIMETRFEVQCTQLSYHKDKINLKPVYFNGVYEGKQDPSKFADDVEKFRRKGLDYSVILYGPPGTGKTTFIMSYAELRRKRVLIIGPEIISNGIDISLYVDVLKPDVLLLDDYDRSGDYNFAYTTLPAIKSRMPHLLVCITCNHPARLGSAILRPGRGGHMVKFDAPDAADKKLIFEKYLDFYKIEPIENLDVDQIVEQLDDEWTHDWVRHLAKMCNVFDTPDDIMKFIEVTNQQLQWVGKDMEEDEY